MPSSDYTPPRTPLFTSGKKFCWPMPCKISQNGTFPALKRRLSLLPRSLRPLLKRARIPTGANWILKGRMRPVPDWKRNSASTIRRIFCIIRRFPMTTARQWDFPFTSPAGARFKNRRPLRNFCPTPPLAGSSKSITRMRGRPAEANPPM